MKRLLVRRGAVGLALGALAITGLASVPASAVITDPEVGAGVWFTDNDSDCNKAGAESGTYVAWSDNGVPVSQSYSASGTHTSTGNPADIVDVSASGSVTVSSTPFTGGAFTVTGSASAASSATSRLASTVCDEYAAATPGAFGEITLTQPMWVTLSASGDGSGGGSAWVEDSTGGASAQVGKRGTAVSTVLAVPGELWFGFASEAYSSVNGGNEESRTYTGTYKLDFQPVGSASAPTGKGSAYTQFGARDCANGNIAAAITKKAKKKAQQVLIKVNGAKVAKFKGKKLKKRTLVLPAAPASAAAVEATIKLKNGKKVTVTRSYLACS